MKKPVDKSGVNDKRNYLDLPHFQSLSTEPRSPKAAKQQVAAEQKVLTKGKRAGLERAPLA